MKLDIKTTNKYFQAFDNIQEAQNILLVTHERPDGDGLASVCAMINLLESLNKNYTAFCSDKPGPSFSFLPFIEKIISDKDFFNFKDFDLIIIFDCGGLNRTGLSKEIEGKSSQFIIEFDHHPRMDNYSDLEIRFPKAAAVSEILYYFFKANNIRITKKIANCILTGILTDTSNFLHPSTTNEVVNIASEMLLYGAQFPKITEFTMHNKSLSAMKLWGIVLSNLKVNKKYNLGYVVISLEEIGKYDDNEDVFDSIATFLSNLQGVKGVMLLREEINQRTGLKQIKGSLRSSHPKIDISKLAAILGGGGHAKSSGFIVDGKLEKTGELWKVV